MLGQEVYILAYSDDIILLVPYGRVAEALLAAKDVLQTMCCLSLRPDKCVVFDPRPGRAPEAEFRPGGALASVQWRGGGDSGEAGLLVLGSPVGSAAFADQALCWDREGPVQRAGDLFRALPRLSTRQEGLVLLRGSGMHMLQYHLRLTPPAATLYAARSFDRGAARAFSALTGISEPELRAPRAGGHPDTSALAQAQLPAASLGHGLRCQEGLRAI